MFLLDEIVDVRNSDLRGEAGVDGAAAGAGAIEIGAGVIGVDNVLGLDSEALEVSVEERRVGIIFSTRGIPIRTWLRFRISATRSLLVLVQARDGIGSA